MNSAANWWIENDGKVKCLLCPHFCLLSRGETGICGVRQAGENGGLILPGFGMITASAMDPIEKKPLYHFYPGANVWSVGFTGCNMDCPFCQNSGISRAEPSIGEFKKPSDIVSETLESGSKLLAFTYSEPTVHYEYLIQTAESAREKGLKTILVTNGNINVKPARSLLNLMDAVNIDLKSWNIDYYDNNLKGNLDTVRRFIREALNYSWVELTTLIIPGETDNKTDMQNMCRWIASLSRNIPLHLSAYHPSYKYQIPAASARLLKDMKNIAEKELNYVYIGNLGIENNTHCPECSRIVIQRKYHTIDTFITEGRCSHCGTVIPGVFP